MPTPHQTPTRAPAETLPPPSILPAPRADLCAAFSPIPPGPVTPPGPQAQDWSTLGPRTAGPWPGAGPPVTVPLPGRSAPGHAPGSLIAWFGALGHHLFFTDEFHRDEASGRPLRVRRRPVPSAGAAYPVQLHLRLGRWRLAYHQEQDAVHDLTAGLPRHAAPADASGRRARLTFTVLPGRSFSRYRHRAWTLWIADVAYAVEAVRHVMAPASSVGTVHEAGPSRLAHQAGLPAGGRWPTAHPELAIQGLDVGRPDGTSLHLPALTPLPHRRSLPLARLAAAETPGRRRAEPEEDALLAAENCSGQHWLAAWPHLRLFTAPKTRDPLRLRRQLEAVHRQAARLTYTEAADGRQVRPVSGFTDVPGMDRRCLHALALDPSPTTGDPHDDRP